MGLHDTVLPWNVGLNKNVSKTAKVESVPGYKSSSSSSSKSYSTGGSSSSRSLNLPGMSNSTFDASGTDTYRLANGTKSNYAAGTPTYTGAMLPVSKLTSGTINNSPSIGAAQKTTHTLTPFLGGYNQVGSTITASPDSVGEQMDRKRKEDEERQKAAERAEAARLAAQMPEMGQMAPRKSQVESVQNPFNEQMRGAMLAQRNAATQRQYTDNLENIRRSMAERGLSQAGMSGIEQDAIIQNEMARGAMLGNNLNDVMTNVAQLGAQFDMQRAGALDQYALSRGGLDIQYGQYGLQAQRQAAMLPFEIDGAMLANEAGRLANEFTRETNPIRKAEIQASLNNTLAALDHFKKMAPIQEQTAQTQLSAAQQELDMLQKTAPGLLEAKIAEAKAAAAQGRLQQWEAENAGWLAGLKFVGNVIIEAARSAAKGGAMALGGG